MAGVVRAGRGGSVRAERLLSISDTFPEMAFGSQEEGPTYEYSFRLLPLLALPLSVDPFP